MGKSEIRSHIQLLNLSRKVFKSVSKISYAQFSSNPQVIQSNLKSYIKILHENDCLNRFSIGCRPSDIWCTIFQT